MRAGSSRARARRIGPLPKFACSKRILEQFEGGRALSVGVIEVVAGEELAPRLQQAGGTAIGDRRRYHILQDVEDAEPFDGGGDQQVGVVEHRPRPSATVTAWPSRSNDQEGRSPLASW